MTLYIFKNIYSISATVYTIYKYIELWMHAGSLREHERSVRVARGAAESNSSFLSALQTSQVYP